MWYFAGNAFSRSSAPNSYVTIQVTFSAHSFISTWKEQSSTKMATDEDVAQAALLHQMQEEEQLLQKSAKSTLAEIGNTSYELLQEDLAGGVVTIDYIFFAPLRENPLLDAYCVVFEKGKSPIVCELDYKAIRNQAAMVTQLLLSQSSTIQGKVDTELAILAKVLFPQELLDILATGKVSHLYISPDSDIAYIPLDSLPVNLGTGTLIPLFEKFSVSILSSIRKLLRSSIVQHAPDSGTPKQVCSIIGNPNFDLCKPATDSSTIERLVNFLCGYFQYFYSHWAHTAAGTAGTLTI